MPSQRPPLVICQTLTASWDSVSDTVPGKAVPGMKGRKPGDTDTALSPGSRSPHGHSEGLGGDLLTAPAPRGCTVYTEPITQEKAKGRNHHQSSACSGKNAKPGLHRSGRWKPSGFVRIPSRVGQISKGRDGKGLRSLQSGASETGRALGRTAGLAELGQATSRGPSPPWGPLFTFRHQRGPEVGPPLGSSRVEPEPAAMEIQPAAGCAAWGESLPALGFPPLTRSWGHNTQTRGSGDFD